ncbi:MAG: sugar phosphate isomerase/epimerase family protein [Phycisphaerales bacterium]
MHPITRRHALKLTAAATLAFSTRAFGAVRLAHAPTDSTCRISLAQWSLHKPLFAGEITNLDFAAEAQAMGFEAIEYVNSFFKDKATDAAYLAQMNRRAADAGVKQLLIMCDGEGNLGDANEPARLRAVENHRKWLEAAKTLDCHSIRVNAASSGTWQEQQERAADGLRRLCELADPYALDVLVENHGGLSSNGKWLSELMRRVDHPRIGTLPDFGNFCMDWSRSAEPDAWYDRYQGVKELMPFAKAVSAKSHDFDEDGNETATDYTRMLGIVRKAGYDGWIGVEYEGSRLAPREGILATKRLIERVCAAWQPPEKAEP